MKPVYKPKKEVMRVAAFMSGKGTNARKLIEAQSGYKVVLIFSDRKESNAEKIAKEYNIAYRCNDINEYYKARGKDKRDMNVRKGFDKETAKWLKEFRIDLVALCGYMSLVTEPIFESYFTINIHPADLSITENGKRKFRGGHAVRDAIETGQKEVRATVHMVTKECDQGPILMISEPVAVKGDASNADMYQERLKEVGDWVIYPQTIRLIAEGRVALDGLDVYIDGKKRKNYRYEELVKDAQEN